MLCIFEIPIDKFQHVPPLITTDEGLIARKEPKSNTNPLGENFLKKCSVPISPIVGQIGTPLLYCVVPISPALTIFFRFYKIYHNKIE